MVDRELHRIQASIDGLQASDCAGQGGYAMPVAQDLATVKIETPSFQNNEIVFEELGHH